MLGITNWKTTLSGILAAAFQGIASAYPDWAPICHIMSGVALAALGITAKDRNVTGGEVPQTVEAVGRVDKVK